jgi:hypothetical protein
VCKSRVRGRKQGATKEVALSKIEGQILRCDRLHYFVVSYYSLGRPLSQDRSPYFILIKSTRYRFSLKGFSTCIYPKNYVCKCVWFPVLLSMIYFCKSLKPGHVFYSVNQLYKFITARHLQGNRLLGVVSENLTWYHSRDSEEETH